LIFLRRRGRDLLATEVSNLQASHTSLGGKITSIKKSLEGSKAAEELALERAAKANSICEGLHKEIEAEMQSSASLESQVTLLSKQWFASCFFFFFPPFSGVFSFLVFICLIFVCYNPPPSLLLSKSCRRRRLCGVPWARGLLLLWRL
jgi:hypothetical protein